MTPLDLKPLTKETIQKMGYSTHDLWMVKMGEEIHGPFEAASLKHYAHENEEIFHVALACRGDQPNEWREFFDHAFFREVGNHKERNALKTHFWLIHQGAKNGPYTHKDIEKKISEGNLAMTDLVSFDEGHNWQKIYQVSLFAKSGNNHSDDLPSLPAESSFLRAKKDVVQKIENFIEHPTTQASIASLAYLGLKDKSISLKLEEIDLHSLNETEVSRSLKWAIPAGVAMMGALILVGHLIFSPSSYEDVASEEASPKKTIAASESQAKSYSSPSANRGPASVAPLRHERSALTQAPSMDHYPTHSEVSHPTNEYPAYEPEVPMDHVDADQNRPEEHSLLQPGSNNPGMPAEELIDSSIPGGEDYSGEQPPQEPVVEEISDF